MASKGLGCGCWETQAAQEEDDDGADYREAPSNPRPVDNEAWESVVEYLECIIMFT